MSQLRLWLHLAALNKVTLRAARGAPGGEGGRPRPRSGAAGPGARRCAAGTFRAAPGRPQGSAPDLDSVWGAPGQSWQSAVRSGSDWPGRSALALRPSSGPPGLREGVQPLPGARVTEPVSAGHSWGLSVCSNPPSPQGRPRAGLGWGPSCPHPPVCGQSGATIWQLPRVPPGLRLVRGTPKCCETVTTAGDPQNCQGDQLAPAPLKQQMGPGGAWGLRGRRFAGRPQRVRLDLACLGGLLGGCWASGPDRGAAG